MKYCIEIRQTITEDSETCFVATAWELINGNERKALGIAGARGKTSEGAETNLIEKLKKVEKIQQMKMATIIKIIEI